LSVDELSVAASFAIQPISNVVIAVRVDEATVAIVDIIDELAFIDYVVNLFSDTCYLAICTKLTNNISVILALSELQ